MPKQVFQNTGTTTKFVDYKKPGEQYSVEAEGQTGKPFDTEELAPGQSTEIEHDGWIRERGGETAEASAETPAPSGPDASVL